MRQMVSSRHGEVTGCKALAEHLSTVNICLQLVAGFARVTVTICAMQSQQRQKILVVDDDLRLRDLLKRYLTDQGFTVDTVPDASAMERSLARTRYDLMVLDLMLPGEDGLAICRRLRAAGNVLSIIMLTAKGDDVDRIVGLELGADDYLAKPFNPRELVARIHAVLRRQAPSAAPGAPSLEPRVVEFGPFAL